ncbi:MAG: CpaD family pilus assembly lipoprotein [bacterium]
MVRRYISLVIGLMGLTLLSACAGKTFDQLEPYTQKPHQLESQEDRIVLALPESSYAPLSKEYQDYIGRFVAYYRDMPNAIFYVSHIQSIADQEMADGVVPAFRPGVEHQIRQVTAAMDALNIPYHRIVEYATDEEASPAEDTKKAGVTVDDKLSDTKKVAVAVIVKQYTVNAAGCVDLSEWSFDRARTTSMSATGMGCANRQNYLAQMKNPQHVVRGRPMDPEYSTMPFVKLQKDVLEGKFKPDSGGESGGSSGSSGGAGAGLSGGQ